MINASVLQNYNDDCGNSVVYNGPPIDKNVRIQIRGSNNRLVIKSPARINRLFAYFDADNGYVEIGENLRQAGAFFKATVRVGADCKVVVGQNVTMTGSCLLSAAEGTSITVGDDCMIATANELRTHDGHPIFEVESGLRMNESRSIAIGNHVWLAKDAVLLGGAKVGDGSVIGYRAVVTGEIPNNCVAVGIPAKVAKRDIAWERPNLSETRPFYKPDKQSVDTTPYWNRTNDRTFDR